MQRISEVKHPFTAEDLARRARAALEASIAHGATRMRTHVEVDPEVGLRGFEGVQAVAAKYAWAIDIELCVFPPERADQQSGTDVLPATDLFLMGRNDTFNIKAAFWTPRRSCDQAATAPGQRLRSPRRCFAMISERSTRLMKLEDYGIAVGKKADVVVLDAASPAQAVAEIREPLMESAACPCCSGALHRIGEDVLERLDVLRRRDHRASAQSRLRPTKTRQLWAYARDGAARVFGTTHNPEPGTARARRCWPSVARSVSPSAGRMCAAASTSWPMPARHGSLLGPLDTTLCSFGA